MALEEAIVFQDIFAYSNTNSSKDVFNLLGGTTWNSEFDLLQTEEKLGSLDILEAQPQQHFLYNTTTSTNTNFSQLVVPNIIEQWDCINSSIEQPDNITAKMSATTCPEFPAPTSEISTAVISSRPKRRRSRSKKNVEDIENQRMTHIAVERNRRKQMNDYLSLLRSLMPHSYVQKVDQASIVGGAINYVKELEQQLQLLSGKNHTQDDPNNSDHQSATISSSNSPFAEFFSFPQYSTISPTNGEKSSVVDDDDLDEDPWMMMKEKNHESAAMADIEVSMVESHANMKIRSKTRPQQLLKMVNELQKLRLTILHLTVTTLDQLVLYSLCLKLEDDCKLNSGEEIATAVNQILARIQDERSLLNA